jgi:hypothetical protein
VGPDAKRVSAESLFEKIPVEIGHAGIINPKNMVAKNFAIEPVRIFDKRLANMHAPSHKINTIDICVQNVRDKGNERSSYQFIAIQPANGFRLRQSYCPRIRSGQAQDILN